MRDASELIEWPSIIGLPQTVADRVRIALVDCHAAAKVIQQWWRAKQEQMLTSHMPTTDRRRANKRRKPKSRKKKRRGKKAAVGPQATIAPDRAVQRLHEWFLKSPVLGYEKMDGTNVSKNDQDYVFGRRLPAWGDNSGRYQGVPLAVVREADISIVRERLLAELPKELHGSRRTDV